MQGVFDYTDFCTEHEIRVFKRVKARQMQLGRACRNVIAGLTHGTIGDGRRSNKQFLNTRYGRYRIALSAQTDNSTETAAHLRMGVETVYAGERSEIMPFLRMHGRDDITWRGFKGMIRVELERLWNERS